MNIAKEVFDAPFCVFVHNYVGDDSDTECTYANKAALSMAAADWGDVVGQPLDLFERSVLDEALSKGQ